MTRLRRGHGVEWCEAGAHFVPEGKMRAREGDETIKLETCRDCQVGRIDTRPRDVKADLARRS
jgi:hypothetical protein